MQSPAADDDQVDNAARTDEGANRLTHRLPETIARDSSNEVQVDSLATLIDDDSEVRTEALREIARSAVCNFRLR